MRQHNFYVKAELRQKAREDAERQIKGIEAAAQEEIEELQAEARAVWDEVRRRLAGRAACSHCSAEACSGIYDVTGDNGM